MIPDYSFKNTKCESLSNVDIKIMESSILPPKCLVVIGRNIRAILEQCIQNHVFYFPEIGIDFQERIIVSIVRQQKRAVTVSNEIFIMAKLKTKMLFE